MRMERPSVTASELEKEEKRRVFSSVRAWFASSASLGMRGNATGVKVNMRVHLQMKLIRLETRAKFVEKSRKSSRLHVPR